MPALRDGGDLDSRSGRCVADRADGRISGAARIVRVGKVHIAEFDGRVGPANERDDRGGEQEAGGVVFTGAGAIPAGDGGDGVSVV